MVGRAASLRRSIIIPVFNEHATIAEVLARVLAVDLDKQVIVVVDDGTSELSPAPTEAVN